MRILLLVLSFLLLQSISFSQNVGIGTTSPSNMLHVIVSPTNPNPNPVRFEGIQRYTTEDSVLVVNPSTGVVKYMPMADVLVNIPPNILDSLILNSIINNTDTIYNNQSIRDSIIAIALSNVDTLFNTQIFRDSVLGIVISNIDTIFTITRDSLLNDSTFINTLRDSIDTDIDSVTFANDTIYIYENGTLVQTYINTSLDTALVDSLIYAKSDSLYTFIFDSLNKDTTWIKQIDSLLSIYGDTIYFNDSSYTLIKDSLLYDSLFLDSLVSLIGDSINTDNQNIDSLTLTGTILTTYIEDGTSASIDVSNMLDSVILSKSDTLYSIISDSLTKDTNWIKQIDSLLSIYGDTIYFNDSTYTLIKDSLLNDTAWLSQLSDSIDSDVDSAILWGDTAIAIYENGKMVLVDISALTDSSEWIDGAKVGLTPGAIYARKAMANGDTTMVKGNGAIAINTNAPITRSVFEVHSENNTNKRLTYIDSNANLMIGAKPDIGPGLEKRYRTAFADLHIANRSENGRPAEIILQGANNGSNFQVGATDTIGRLRFWGTDSQYQVDQQEASRIEAGTVTPGWGANPDDVTGDLRFLTNDSADGLSSIERMRITHNGNIGIGTTTPTDKLHLLNSAASMKIESTGSPVGTFVKLQVDISNNVRAKGIVTLDTTSKTSWFYGNPYNGGAIGESDKFVINRLTNYNSNFDNRVAAYRIGAVPTGSKNLFTVDTNGNIGVGGIKSPTNTLDIDGKTRIRIINDTNNVVRVLTANDSGVIQSLPIDSLAFQLADSSEWIDGAKVGLTPGAIYARKALARGDTVTIGTNAFLGVGTSAPTTNLHIKSTQNNPFILQNSLYDKSDNSAYNFISFNDSNNLSYGIIGDNSLSRKQIGVIGTNNHSVVLASFNSTQRARINLNLDTYPASIMFSTKSIARAIIDSNGNLGLGTTTPTIGKLHIRQNNDISNGGIGVTNSLSTAGMRLWMETSNTGHIDIGSSGTYNLILNEGGGYIGIGEPNPQNNLHVTSSSTEPVPLKLERLSTQTVAQLYKNNQDSIYIGLSNTEDFAIGANEDLTINPYLTIDHAGTTGNIGINTINPSSKLHINGAIATPIVTTVANITLDNTHSTVIVTGGTPTITFPAATGISGRKYILVNQTAIPITTSINYIDFTGSAIGTIPANSSITIQSDGISWYRIQ